MRKTETLSPDRVRELFSYEQDGKVVWKVSKPHSVKAGQVAGRQLPTGHLQVIVDRRSYMISRIVYCLVTGEWPAGLLEHIDGDKNNCKFENLRVISSQERALKAKRDNTRGISGHIGVTWCKRLGKWKATIRANGRRQHIGLFTCPKQAAKAYQQAKAAILAAYGEKNNAPRIQP